MPRDDGVAFERGVGDGLIDDLCQAKIADLYKSVAALSLLHDKDICRFEIAVQNAEIVCRLDAVGDLPEQANGTFDGQRSLAAKQFVQRLALDIFHHEIENAVRRFAKIGHADRIWMLDRRGGLGLAFKRAMASPSCRSSLLRMSCRTVLTASFLVSNFLSLAR